jgi:hypothetical protein
MPISGSEGSECSAKLSYFQHGFPRNHSKMLFKIRRASEQPASSISFFFTNTLLQVTNLRRILNSSGESEYFFPQLRMRPISRPQENDTHYLCYSAREFLFFSEKLIF